MGKLSLEPYIFFQGNAKQAMEFYKDVFGGELTMQTIGDLPKGAPSARIVLIQRNPSGAKL
jgi:PhnB protein